MLIQRIVNLLFRDDHSLVHPVGVFSYLHKCLIDAASKIIELESADFAGFVLFVLLANVNA